MWWLAIRITKPQCGIFIKRRCQNGGLAGTDLMFLTCVCTSPGLKNLISGRPPMFPSSGLPQNGHRQTEGNAARGEITRCDPETCVAMRQTAEITVGAWASDCLNQSWVYWCPR